MEDDITLVRKRPGMYIGSTSARGALQLVYELLDNAIDPYLVGKTTQVHLRLEGDLIEVTDDGPGLPFEATTDGVAAGRMTEFLTSYHRTNTADDHIPHIHLGALGGVGLAIVNALSAELTVTSWRGGQRWEQSFVRGRPTRDAAVTADAAGRGTKVRAVVDPEIFHGVVPPPDAARILVIRAAYLIAGLKIGFNGEWFHAPGGLRDYGPLVAREQGVAIRAEDPFHVRYRAEAVAVEIAAFSCSGPPETASSETNIQSWANAVPTIGGTHVKGLQDLLHDAGWKPALALVHVVMHDARYSGPTKQVLESPPARKAVAEGARAALADYCRRRTGAQGA